LQISTLLYLITRKWIENEAIERMNADIIVFLDADIRNLTTDWVNELVGAIINDNCDMSRGFYTRHARDAAVTKLIARPM
jgi:hypothetical protein